MEEEQDALNEGGQDDERPQREDKLKRLYRIRDEARARVISLQQALDEAEDEYLAAKGEISAYHRARGARG